jgi:hypothetical protein
MLRLDDITSEDITGTPTGDIESFLCVIFISLIASFIFEDMVNGFKNGIVQKSNKEEVERKFKEMEKDYDEDFYAIGKAEDSSDDCPKDGVYVGKAFESNVPRGQKCQSTLKFHKDGTVSGSGLDGIDGAYTIY